MKVLVVEDEPLAAELLVDLLGSGLGCEVFAATNVKDSLAILKREPELALIICDINLPDSSGLNLIRYLRSEPAWAAIPILVCTGHKNEPMVKQLRELGVRFCLDKPVNRDMVRGSLRAMLGDTPGEVPRRLKVLLALDLELSEYLEIQTESRGLLEKVLAKHLPGLSKGSAEHAAKIFWPCVWDRDCRLKVSSTLPEL